MNKIFLYVSVLILVVALSSCDLLFGPLKSISLSQRLNRGWVSTEIANFSDPLTLLTNGKLQLFSIKGEVNAIFGKTNFNKLFLLQISEKKATNLITNNTATGGMMYNIFDLFSDNTNFSVIYLDNSGILKRYKDGAPLQFGYTAGNYDPFFIHFDYTKCAGFNTIGAIFTNRGADINNLDNSTIFWATNLSFSGYSFMGKCKGKYNSKNIFYISMSNINLPNDFDLFFSYEDSSVFPNAIFSKPTNSPLLLAADNSQSLYLINQFSIYKYNSSSSFLLGTFQKDMDISEKLLTPLNGYCTAIMVGTTLFIMSIDLIKSPGLVSIISYDTFRKSYIINTLNITSQPLEGADLFYDPISSRLCIGIAYIDPGLNIRINLYTAQL